MRGFKILKPIAKGSFGKVYKGFKNGSECAVKFVNLKDREGDFDLEGMTTAFLSGQNIGPKVLDCWKIPSEDLGVIVSDLYSGSLDDFMDRNRRKTVPANVMNQVKDQVKRLHMLGHAHLDLHGGNVLVKWDSTGKKVTHATITDFGKTQRIEGIEKDRIKLPIELFDLKKTKCPKEVDLHFIDKLRLDYK